MPALREIQQNYPSADVFVSGDLTVDFPEDIQIPFTKNNYATASLNGTILKLSYCPLDDAIVLFFARTVCGGTLEIKVVQLRAKYDI